jgi:type I restriction enzyme S subunit
MRIRLNNTRVLTKYFLYYFQSPEVQARIFTRSPGATIKNLFATKNLRSFKTPLPPLPVQKRIVASVEKADDLRQRREKTNQMTNAIACSVFLEMFGSVDPKNKIGDIATHVSSGSTPLGGEKTYSKEGIIFIRSQNVLMNSLDLQDVAHISEKTHYEMKRTWVKNGDVLLNITGASMGRVAVFRGEDNQANVNQHVCIIRLDQTKALPEYVSFYLSSPRGQKQMWTIQAGASRQALNYNQVRLLGVYLPSLDEQSEFVMITRRIDSLRNKQAQSTKRIDELFHSLVQKAFDGDLPTGEKGNQKIDKSLFESEPV